MPNIAKGFNIIFLLFVGGISFSQKILPSSVNLNINSGGIIYDVEHDPHNNVYILVGDFNSIGGISVNNIAFLNDQTFAVDTSYKLNVIQAIDGPIYAVELRQYLSSFLPFNHYYHLFLGGAFSNVTVGGTAYSRPGICKLYHSGIGGYIANTAPYSMHSWNPDLDWPLVHDIEVMGDTVAFVGDFFDIYDNSSPITTPYNAAFRVSNGTYLAGYPNLVGFFNPPNYPKHLERMYGSLYISTEYTSGNQAKVYKILPGGGIDPAFNQGVGSADGFYQMKPVSTSLIACQYNSPSGGGFFGAEVVVLNKDNGTFYPNHSFTGPATPGSRMGLAVYKDFLYCGTGGSTHPIRGYQMAVDESSLSTYAWGGGGSTSPDFTSPYDQFHVANNFLFVSAPNLTSAGGAAHTGLAVYCMEPMDAQFFTAYDTTICHNDIVTYTIPQAQFADGYIWEFSGSDVAINNLGEFDSYEDVSSINGNSVSIKFGENFTPGVLKVTPYSSAYGLFTNTLDYQKSESVEIPIMLNPLPNANAGIDTILNCYFPSTDLVGLSDTAGVTYDWKKSGPNPYTSGQIYTTVDSGIFVLKVTSPVGCIKLDSVNVLMDMIYPTFDPVPGPYDFTCVDTTVSLLGNCNNALSYTGWWKKLGFPDSLFNNPLTVTQSQIGQYRYFAQNLINGCVDSLTSPIPVNFANDAPQASVLGYSDTLQFYVPIDTITCFQPSITLDCYSSTPFTTVNWSDSLGQSNLGTSLIVSSQDTLWIHVVNDTNGCETIREIRIAENTAKPNLFIDPILNINCSNDSVLLNGSTSVFDTSLAWTGTSLFSNTNPTWASSPGYYSFTVNWNFNGCSRTDSILVIADNSIDVYASNDTIVCDLAPIPVAVSYGGSISGINYLWNNGQTGPNTVYTGGQDTYAAIEVFGNGGCYGVDTVNISIPPNPVVEFAGFAPCASGGGSIVANPISGWAPFEYSIDNGINFQSSTTFSGLNFGSYDLQVKDSLGCIYDFQAYIDANSQTASPNFLVTTYNQQTDTLIAIDVSNPSPDSLSWQFPSQIVLLNQTQNEVTFLLPDTGSFDITLNAYYGSCEGSLTKIIFVNQYDTTGATLYNLNGIKSVNLYPIPNNGTFNLDVEFYKSQNAFVSVTNMLGTAFASYEFYDVTEISEVVTLNLSAAESGTYVLRVVGEYDTEHVQFVINP